MTARQRRRRHVNRPPAAFIALAALGLGVFVVPLIGLLARTPWRRLPSLLTGEVVADAPRLSLITSLAATAISAWR